MTAHLPGRVVVIARTTQDGYDRQRLIVKSALQEFGEWLVHHHGLDPKTTARAVIEFAKARGVHADGQTNDMVWDWAKQIAQPGDRAGLTLEQAIGFQKAVAEHYAKR